MIIFFRNFEEIELKMLVKEKKMDKLQKIRFDATVSPLNDKLITANKLNLKLYEIIMGSKKSVKEFPDQPEFNK